MRRLAEGGRIDRRTPLSVRFDGRDLPAFKGDTLASAMLAGGCRIVARSFKYHRPRGVFSSGTEEPNALVHLGTGERQEPNVRATTLEAFDGLTATAQNAWPSVRFDLGAVNDALSPLLSAGFYYKTFIGFFPGTRFWMFCESFIRRAAGIGRGTTLEDPDAYEKRHTSCDVLVIGGGIAGLSAALAAGRAGARVILVEQDFELGGALLAEPAGGPADSWLRSVVAELDAMAAVRILLRTTAIGAYDGDTYALIEPVSDHPDAGQEVNIRQRYWQVCAARTVLATGAIEQPLIFGNNDKPGIMLASAARSYLNRFAVLPGERVVVSTSNDSAYAAAIDLARAGADVTVADLRPEPEPALAARAAQSGVTVLAGHGILSAKGAACVKRAVVVPVDSSGRVNGEATSLGADLILVSGGWSPAIHLWSQRYGKPDFDAEAHAFVAGERPGATIEAVGAAAAARSVEHVIAQGFAAGTRAAGAAGASGDSGAAPNAPNCGGFWQRGSSPVAMVLERSGRPCGKAFVDLQNDVKVSDIDLAHLEGYVSVEHLKRYTTAGMGADQGKTSNLNALMRLAELRGEVIQDVGTTTFRPPFVPTAIGALVGHEHGQHFRPTRRTPIHPWHEANGARMIEAGAWLRPWYYPEPGEDLRAAAIREATQVRQHVGMIDVSTLGKIAVQGPDAAEFLNRVYVNGWKALEVGRIRYGIMLRDDGIVMDDGTTARLGEHDYFMTTTTAQAAKILAWLEHLLQTAWTDLRVHVTSVTDQWATIAVAGPKSRDLLTAVTPGTHLSAAALPSNHLVVTEIGGAPVRIHRMSYSGELAYEVYAPSGFGLHVWEMLLSAGPTFGLRVYGTEAMGTLRIEKGHIAGPEIDGRTTLGNVGMERFASTKKPFVGSVLRKRPHLVDPDTPTLIGLELSKGTNGGALLFAETGEMSGHGDGWVSSTTVSPALGRHIALAFLKRGADRAGETVRVADFLADSVQTARVVSPHFFDPEGVRQNG